MDWPAVSHARPDFSQPLNDLQHAVQRLLQCERQTRLASNAGPLLITSEPPSERHRQIM